MNTSRVILGYCRAAIAFFLIVNSPGQPAARLLSRLEGNSVWPLSGSSERQLTHRESHRYSAALQAGESLSAVVEQRGVDVVVRVLGADGQAFAEFQDEVGLAGKEHVSFVADADATYTVVLASAAGTKATGEYTLRVTARRPATGRDRLIDEARRLRTAAVHQFDRNRTDEAVTLFEQALGLTEQALGSDSGAAGQVMAQLAAAYADLPDFQRAESSYLRALSILDRDQGATAPATAFVRSRLATLYQLTGQRPRAETMLLESMATIEKALGTEHIWYVRCLATLAMLRGDAGDFQEATKILERELAILEDTDQADTMLYAGVLNNLGGIYGRSRNPAQAERFLERALALGETLRGADDYFLSNPLVNLGVLARERKDYRTAEARYLRALAIRQQIAGENSSEIALILNNLANLYHATGDYHRALEMHRRALLIGEQAYGPFHHNTLLSVGNLARTSTALGDLDAAVAYERQADRIIEKQLALNLTVGSERQKQLFVHSIAERTDRTVSLHLDRMPNRPEASVLGAQVLLQRKGRVLDAMLDTVGVVRQHATSAEDRELFDRLNAASRELADLALRGASQAGDRSAQQAIRDAESRIEQLQAALAGHSAMVRAELSSMTLEDVQSALPGDAALIEFGLFRSYDPAAERNADAYGLPHYAAYVVQRFGPPTGFDLGDAGAIDQLIAALRAELRDPRGSHYRRAARALFDRVMAPLASSYGDARRLLVSPDGNLNLVPFEALVDQRGRFLVEGFPITYLTSGRDLLRMGAVPSSGNPPVVIANPAFGEPAARDRSTIYFVPLPGSAAEARAIKVLFPQASVLTGARATKRALIGVEAPMILHVASHGFLLQDAGAAVASGSATNSGVSSRAVTVAATVQNPMLRSGLALANANVNGRAHEDGILTALEASGLNLWGTRLVTLSACDSALGEVRNGEGVYGFRRAFTLAGAESLVISLWPVNDAVARETMVMFYQRLRAGRGRGDALRETKLQLMRRPGRRHPFYWATFIQSGEWANLNGVR